MLVGPGNPSPREQKSLPVLVVFILPGDQGHDLLDPIDVELRVLDLHGEPDDRSSNNLYCMGKKLPLRYSQESMF